MFQIKNISYRRYFPKNYLKVLYIMFKKIPFLWVVIYISGVNCDITFFAVGIPFGPQMICGFIFFIRSNEQFLKMILTEIRAEIIDVFSPNPFHKQSRPWFNW